MHANLLLSARYLRFSLERFLPAGMRRVWAVVLVFLVSSILAGCAARLSPTERMMHSTYPVFTNKSAATGFIVSIRSSDSRRSLPVLFTTFHALKSLGDGPLLIGAHPAGYEDGSLAPIIACLPASAVVAQEFFARHPTLDIAAFPIELPPEFGEIVNIESCLSAKSLVYPGSDLKAGTEVAFLGYPSVLPGTNGNFAVLRSGRIASYPITREASGGQFLINSDVYPGDSGAPVFIVRKDGRPRLAGMVTERVGKDAESFSHLAIAVDAQAIREVLEQFDATIAGREKRSGAEQNAALRRK